MGRGLLIGLLVGLLIGAGVTSATVRLGDQVRVDVTHDEYRQAVLTLAVKLKALERRVEALREACE